MDMKNVQSLAPPRPAPQTDLMISKYIMDQLIDEYGYSEEGRLRQNMNSDDLLSLSNFFWVVHTAAYPLERDLLQLWCMILFCASTTARAGTVVESSCYYGHNDAVQYRDIRLYAMPDPDSPSQGVKLGMLIRLRLLKGRRNRGNPPWIKFVERRDTPSFCLVKFVLGFAFRDSAFASPRIRDPIDLWNIKIPDRLKSVPIEWAPQWESVPVFRRSVRDSGGRIVTSPHLASQYGQMAAWTRRLGREFGMPEPLEFKVFRRTAASAVSREATPYHASSYAFLTRVEKAPSSVRNQIMGHEHDGIWQRHYQNDVANVDVVAAVLDKPSDESSMRLLGHVSLTRDPNAPTRLTSSQRRQVMLEPEVRAVKKAWQDIAATIRHEHKTVSGARELARGDLELRGRLAEHDRLYRSYNSKVSKLESEELESLRLQYFQTLGSTCLENQYLGREEAAEPPPTTFTFSERQELAALLFREASSCDDQIQNGARIVRLLCALCGRQDSRRGRRALEDADQPDSPPVQDSCPEACFIDTCPDIFPVVCPGMQCLFCLGDDSLAPHIRTYSFSKSFSLTRHVQNQHLRYLTPGVPFICPHPQCSVMGTQCEDADHFKRHAIAFHNIIHCA
ncbi:hypothetical protein LTR90_009265 [Exophiala xenobiotica]|nr:hypothetical protein LTR90_009265 [Exophiala xenobiotica]